MDTRCWRLDWPPGTAVWEVDSERLLGFKQRVLGDQQLACARRAAVACDVRHVQGAAGGCAPCATARVLRSGPAPQGPEAR
jgi:O-methyltransferase involved in polyketide biosynthesis